MPSDETTRDRRRTVERRVQSVLQGLALLLIAFMLNATVDLIRQQSRSDERMIRIELQLSQLYRSSDAARDIAGVTREIAGVSSRIDAVERSTAALAGRVDGLERAVREPAKGMSDGRR